MQSLTRVRVGEIWKERYVRPGPDMKCSSLGLGLRGQIK